MKSYLHIIEHTEVADEFITFSRDFSWLNLDTQID